MPVGPFSRYRNLAVLEVGHARRGVTRSLPLRRPPSAPPPPASRRQRYSEFEPLDLLALKQYGREELWWYLADANGGRLPNAYQAGEMFQIPPLDLATRVERPRS